jgi:hypothetical protein
MTIGTSVTRRKISTRCLDSRAILLVLRSTLLLANGGHPLSWYVGTSLDGLSGNREEARFLRNPRLSSRPVRCLCDNKSRAWPGS